MPRLLLVVVCLLVARSTESAPLQITSGSIDAPGPGFGTFFNVSFAGDNFSGFLTGLPFHHGFAIPCPCVLGSVLSNSGGMAAGSGVAGQFTLDDVTYPANFLNNGLAVSFSGPPFIQPQSSEITVTMFSTFTLSGLFTYSPQFPQSGNESFAVEFAGIGNASMTLTQIPAEFWPNSASPLYSFASAHHEFVNPAAIPEPTSLLLLGPALVGLWRRRY